MSLINYIGLDARKMVQKSKSDRELGTPGQTYQKQEAEDSYNRVNSGVFHQSQTEGVNSYNIRLTDLRLEHENFTTFR